MLNEVLLIASLLVIYSGIIVLFKIFKEQGLYLWTIVATIGANIEVMIVVNAFGMEQTLGNILFASSFLVTDICSELYGKKTAKRAVYLGLATSISFIFLTQSWMFYIPNENDWAMPHIKAVFSNTPRLMIVGIGVYVVVQTFDVWAYHKWWDFTSKICGDSHKYLWLRNNGSTLLSQLLNTVLFTVGAFYGTFNVDTLAHIATASYVIYIVTSLTDTPFVYIARKIKEIEDKNVTIHS
ncbi:queuosine precursor transporter [Lachnospiraceae bacterium ZAX-1]